MASQIIFALILIVSGFAFYRSVRRIVRSIKLGKPEKRNDHKSKRWKNMLLVAFGQKKMFKRPFPALLHLSVYVGFLVINIEVIEILIDGLFGTHRALAPVLGNAYNWMTTLAEFFMAAVFIACVIFLVRRYSGKVKRFHSPEMTKWPKIDALIILWTEIVLVTALIIMNAADQNLQAMNAEHYIKAGYFPVSRMIAPLFSGLSVPTLIFIERAAWWFHIIGILAFLNFIPYSKHLHIFLAFPNTYFSNTYIYPLGKFPVLEEVKKEVELMFSDDPYADTGEEEEEIPALGAKDIFDLTWIDLLSAYTCTECGRCTSVCPANQTGKKLSPRKIMMDTRDRAEEVISVIQEKGKWTDDGKTLIKDYISEEEIWACVTCNACAEECPVNINPVQIIMKLRNHLVLDEGQMPEALMTMSRNIENNGAPWALAAADRFNWAKNINK